MFDTNEEIFKEIKKSNLTIHTMRAKIFYKKCMTKFIALFLTVLNIILVITRLFGST